MTVIRSVEPGDIDAMFALEEAVQPRPWSRGVFEEEVAADNRIYLAAEDDGIIGFGGLMVVGEEAHVMNLLVDPAHRGRGVGRELMGALIESAVGAGATHMTLEVRLGNTAARALYAGLGFAPVGVRPNYYEDDDALIMWAHDIGHLQPVETP